MGWGVGRKPGVDRVKNPVALSTRLRSAPGGAPTRTPVVTGRTGTLARLQGRHRNPLSGWRDSGTMYGPPFFPRRPLPPLADAHHPHTDPAAWPGLMEAIGVDSALVLIASWMGPRLRQSFSAEDLWQEALCLAWRDRADHEWVSPRRFRAWVLQIARNRVRDAAEWLEAKKRGGAAAPRSLSSLRATAGASVSELLPAVSTTPSRIVHHAERAAAMEAALSRMPKGLRDVIWLYLFEGKPMPEVAGQVGVSVATAKRRFFEASQQFRRLLQEQLGTRVDGSFHKR